MTITRARRASSPFDLYLSEIDRTALLTASEERELATLVQTGDLIARDRLVRANLRLVVSIARQYSGKGLPVEDLVSEGNMGLLRAAEGFDPAAGTRFATYATYWIRQSLRRALSRSGNTIRLPSYVWTLIVKWHRAAATLQRELGHGATEDEIARRLGLSPRQTRAVLKALRVLSSSQTSGELDGENPLEQMASRGGQCPEDELTDVEQIQAAMASLVNLTEREVTILRLRFGLGGSEPVTLKEVGKQLGYTRERVRQIERDALAKLRNHVAA